MVKRVLAGFGIAAAAIGVAVLAPMLRTSGDATVEPASPALPVVETAADAGADVDALREVATPTADELWLCRFRGDLFELAPSAGVSPDTAMRALATRLVTANPETIASAYVESPYETAGRPPRIRVIPASDAFDLATAASTAIAGLPAEFRDIVSIDDLYATTPVGYSFSQLCAVYIEAANAGDATIGTAGAAPAWVSLALVTAEATVEIGVDSSVSDFAATLKDRYGDVVSLVQESEEGLQLYALRRDGG